jgi:hypothetical protein
MGFNQLIERYTKQIHKQINRKEREGRDVFTGQEVRALKYYKDVRGLLVNLNGTDEETSGFDMVATNEAAAIRFGKTCGWPFNSARGEAHS